MIVMKFGGSSIESAAAIERVAGIVKGRAERRPLVVVSALGKTTDRLLELARLAVEGDEERALRLAEDLAADHAEIAAAVSAKADGEQTAAFLDSHFEELTALIKSLAALGELTPRSSDAVSSFGERLSSYVVVRALSQAGLDAVRVDSRDVVVTDDRHTAASPLVDETRRRFHSVVGPLIERGKTVVMGGFIASTEHGVTSTLGRGGSDFTASLVGSLAGAEEVEIWTDVDGVMTADPSLVPDAHRIRVMSFAEASELAYFGARVLHPATMAPAIENDIPVTVLNSRRPGIEGTRIVSKPPESRSIVKSIAYKEQITVVDIRSTRMLMAHGFLARVFHIFDKYETPVDMVSTSEISVSLTVDRPERLDRILAELEEFAEVTRRNGQAIVCVVGDGIRYTPGVAATIFNALNGIRIEMISLGSERLNVGFVVDENDLAEVVARLHRTFFSEIDETVIA